MPHSPMVRLSPLQIGELPDHPLFQQSESTDTARPDLLPFLVSFLDAGNQFIDDKNFNLNFKSHSDRPAPPSNTKVEVLTQTISSEELKNIDWKDTKVPGFQRSTPRDVDPEHWFARRSYHKNVSVKLNSSSASWAEFVYGLRDEHSKHEFDFTPTLYDAHHILDWNEEIHKSAEAWQVQNGSVRSNGQPLYSNITFAIYEMCHAIPWPMDPRCFPVLVATASTSESCFIAVTSPVNLDNFPGAFYSNRRNKTEGQDSQQRKEVVIGRYAAVEKVDLYEKEMSTNPDQKEELIQWVMATASDAAGNLPMSVQRSQMPSQIPKDVTFFLNWVREVSDEDIKNQKPATHTSR